MGATPDELTPIIFQLTLRTWRTIFIINILPKPIKLVNAKKIQILTCHICQSCQTNEMLNLWKIGRAGYLSQCVLGLFTEKYDKSNWWCQYVIIMMIMMMINILIETSGPSLGSSVLKVPLVDSGKEAPFS